MWPISSSMVIDFASVSDIQVDKYVRNICH